MFRNPTIPKSGSYAEKCKTAIVPAQNGKQIVFHGATVNNRSTAEIAVGLGFTMPNALWKAGQIDVSETPYYIDDTTDAQDIGATDFPLFTTTNNDGFLVQSPYPFSLVGITMSATVCTGSPVYTYTYWDGDSWENLTLIDTPNFTGAGDTYLHFEKPIDWTEASGTAVSAIGATTGYYTIQVKATTAPTIAGIATILWVVDMYEFKAGVTDKNVVNFGTEAEIRGIPLMGGQGIVPYFGTAHANNMASVRYSVRG